MKKLYFIICIVFIIASCHSYNGYDYNQSVADFDLEEYSYFMDELPTIPTNGNLWGILKTVKRLL